MKLTIAVQKPRESNITLREETSYRWDRIAATGVGAMSLLAFVVWVFWPTGKPDDAEQLALQERTGGVLAMGQSTLYPLLYNLEAKKWIRGAWRTAESGRRRKYYELTALGKKRLQAQRDQWQDLVGAMEGLGLVKPRIGD